MANRTAAIIVTTVAITLFTVFWSYIDRQFCELDSRLRCVEQQIAAISARLGIEKPGLTLSLTQPTGHPAGPQDDFRRKAGQ